MREILTDVHQWKKEGKEIALATVIKTWGSSPRKAGAHMAINSNGEFTGSVSGGCIEGAVVEIGLEVIKLNKSGLHHFGISDDNAWEVGLACGGEIDVFVQPFETEMIETISSLIVKDESFSYSFVIEGPISRVGQLNVQKKLTHDTYPQVEKEKIDDEEITKFIDVILPSPVLIIVGGVHITENLAQIAKTLKYKTIVIDPRRAFGTKKRFPEIDQLITSWPNEAFNSLNLNRSTAIVTLTHDPKIDDPALIHALDSPVFYIGALGSVKTHHKRRKRLLDQGFSAEQINKIKSPIGLDIGSQVPSEIAVAIMAEIIAEKYGN
jgi:xanthine dehydrogenase accessory factor